METKRLNWAKPPKASKIIFSDKSKFNLIETDDFRSVWRKRGADDMHKIVPFQPCDGVGMHL